MLSQSSKHLFSSRNAPTYEPWDINIVLKTGKRKFNHDIVVRQCPNGKRFERKRTGGSQSATRKSVVRRTTKDGKQVYRIKIKHEDEWSRCADTGSLQDEDTDIEPYHSDTSEHEDGSGAEEQDKVNKKRDELGIKDEQSTTWNDALSSKASIPSKNDLLSSPVRNEAEKASVCADQPIRLRRKEQVIMSIILPDDKLQRPLEVSAAEAETFSSLTSPFPTFINPAREALKTTKRCTDHDCKCSDYLDKESPSAAAPEVYISESFSLSNGSIQSPSTAAISGVQMQTEPQGEEEEKIVYRKITLVGRRPVQEKCTQTKFSYAPRRPSPILEEAESEPVTGRAQIRNSSVPIRVASVPVIPSREPLRQNFSFEAESPIVQLPSSPLPPSLSVPQPSSAGQPPTSSVQRPIRPVPHLRGRSLAPYSLGRNTSSQKRHYIPYSSTYNPRSRSGSTDSYVRTRSTVSDQQQSQRHMTANKDKVYSTRKKDLDPPHLRTKSRAESPGLRPKSRSLETNHSGYTPWTPPCGRSTSGLAMAARFEHSPNNDERTRYSKSPDRPRRRERPITSSKPRPGYVKLDCKTRSLPPQSKARGRTLGSSEQMHHSTEEPADRTSERKSHRAKPASVSGKITRTYTETDMLVKRAVRQIEGLYKVRRYVEMMKEIEWVLMEINSDTCTLGTQAKRGIKDRIEVIAEWALSDRRESCRWSARQKSN